MPRINLSWAYLELVLEISTGCHVFITAKYPYPTHTCSKEAQMFHASTVFESKLLVNHDTSVNKFVGKYPYFSLYASDRNFPSVVENRVLRGTYVTTMEALRIDVTKPSTQYVLNTFNHRRLQRPTLKELVALGMLDNQKWQNLLKQYEECVALTKVMRTGVYGAVVPSLGIYLDSYKQIHLVEFGANWGEVLFLGIRCRTLVH